MLLCILHALLHIFDLQSSIYILRPDSHLQLRVTKRNVFLSTRLLHPLRSTLIRIPLLQPPHVLVQLGVARLAQRQPLRGTLKSEMDHDIGSCELVAAEELALAGRFDEVVLEEVEVRLQLWVDEARVDLTGDAVGDGLEEEGYGGIFDV